MSFELERDCKNVSTDFSAIARDVLSLSSLFVDREKISTEDLIDIWPDGVTFNRFDLINDKCGRSVPVFTLAEDDTIFYFGGSILNKIVHAFIQKYNGDIPACQKAFEISGGLHVKLSFVTSKSSGFQYVNVEVL